MLYELSLIIEKIKSKWEEHKDYVYVYFAIYCLNLSSLNALCP